MLWYHLSSSIHQETHQLHLLHFFFVFYVFLFVSYRNMVSEELIVWRLERMLFCSSIFFKMRNIQLVKTILHYQFIICINNNSHLKKDLSWITPVFSNLDVFLFFANCCKKSQGIFLSVVWKLSFKYLIIFPQVNH